ncbi:MAG: hypothetical protein EBZ49_00755 [Proteobacteria bacterium]|nr:hypothetical protein [Pseudomonadota bacterium]
MSKIEAQESYLIATALGNVVVRDKLVSDADVEDVVKSQAISQARLIQMVNVGKQIDKNAVLPAAVLPSVFRDAGDE